MNLTFKISDHKQSGNYRTM